MLYYIRSSQQELTKKELEKIDKMIKDFELYNNRILNIIFDKWKQNKENPILLGTFNSNIIKEKRDIINNYYKTLQKSKLDEHNIKIIMKIKILWVLFTKLSYLVGNIKTKKILLNNNFKVKTVICHKIKILKDIETEFLKNDLLTPLEFVGASKKMESDFLNFIEIKKNMEQVVKYDFDIKDIKHLKKFKNAPHKKYTIMCNDKGNLIVFFRKNKDKLLSKIIFTFFSFVGIIIINNNNKKKYISNNLYLDSDFDQS